MANPPAPPLLVFADDWGRHPSSCQHLVRRLLPRREVLWVNTVMRPPRFDRETLRRGREKLYQWLGWDRPASLPLPSPPSSRGRGGPVDNPCVINPRMWPSFASARERRLNHWLLTRQLGPILQSLPVPPVAVTTLPIVADLTTALPVERWVYYCVDDFSLWPGLDGPTLRLLEEELLPRMDEIVAVSETLRDRLVSMTGRRVRLLTHGVDLDFWASDAESNRQEFARLQRPLVVFWGVIDRRMDVDFVRRLAADLESGTIVLAGPTSDPDPALLRLPRVVTLPPQPMERLPALARAASVLVMPYADLPVTRAMQPLKLKEYLASGRPVVLRDLPATREWSDACDLAGTPQEFSRTVRERLRTGLPEAHRVARQRLADESWDAKARTFERWLRPRRPVPALV